MKLNTNILAMNSVRNLMATGLKQKTALERLSSGKKINRAADNAAGYAISKKMALQSSGLKMASKNSLDGISLIQTAEGALDEVHSMLQRMRELSVQASNDSNTYDDRDAIQKEINQLTSEINRIGKTTEFNQMKMFLSTNDDGTYKSTMNIPVQGGANAKQMIDIEFQEMSAYKLGISSSYPGERALGFPDDIKLRGNMDPEAGKGIPESAIPPALPEPYPNNISDLYDKTEIVPGDPTKGYKYTIKEKYQSNKEKDRKSILGQSTSTVITDKNGNERKIQFDFVKKQAPANTWDVYGFYVNNDGAMVPMTGSIAKTNLSTPGNGLVKTLTFNADGTLPASATETLSMNISPDTIGNIKVNFSGITQKQDFIKDHKMNNLRYYNDIPLGDKSIINRDYNTHKPEKDNNDNILYKKEYALDVRTQEAANTAIQLFNNAISKISEIRSILGAAQNRFEHNIKSLNAAEENVTSSMSRIEDADMAEEMTEFTKYNILQQAGTSMLAQANQLPQTVLKLLES
ncbi:MAG: flagellin N-terminal helical domain-containing protein [Peptoanaerobacter stomatis]|uniref:flagellin N-terminal helical domain-containing protein n=1 Tax=Peptoanaerobacter stomatis TaxID=796937 RepID=UPI003FA0E830